MARPKLNGVSRPGVEPTAGQLRVLEAVAQYRARHNYGPSVREVVEMLGLASVNGVNEHLGHLEAKGLISREAKKARTASVTSRGAEWLGSEAA